MRFLNLGPESLEIAKNATALHDVALELFSGMHHPLTVVFGLVAIAAPPSFVATVADTFDTNPHVLGAGLVVGSITLAGLAGASHEVSTALREQARVRFPRPVAKLTGSVAVVALTAAASLFSSLGQLDRMEPPSSWWEGPKAEKSNFDRLQLFLAQSHAKRSVGGR